jgi:hypothetical protein
VFTTKTMLTKETFSVIMLSVSSYTAIEHLHSSLRI